LPWIIAILAVLAITGLIAGSFYPNADAGQSTPPLSLRKGAAVDDTRVRYPRGEYPVLALPDGQKQVVKSLLLTSTTMQYGDFIWDDLGVANGPIWIRIDLTEQLLSVFRGADEIGTTVISYGNGKHPTPTGVFPILGMDRNHVSANYGAAMPYALRLTSDGVAIHASLVRSRYATHGCIGVPWDFARQLFNIAQKGDPVFVVP
jgi:hypothetical protein